MPEGLISEITLVRTEDLPTNGEFPPDRGLCILEVITLPSKAEVEGAIEGLDGSRGDVDIFLTCTKALILLLKSEGRYEGWK